MKIGASESENDAEIRGDGAKEAHMAHNHETARGSNGPRYQFLNRVA